MIWVFVVAGALVVFAVAAAMVGREAFRLGHEPPAAIFDVEEATFVVGDGLPDDVQARLSYEDVRAIVLATLDRLRALGLGAFPGEELEPIDRDVVVADDDMVAHVLGALEGTEHAGNADEDVFRVITGLLEHLRSLGAFGPPGTDAA